VEPLFYNIFIIQDLWGLFKEIEKSRCDHLKGLSKVQSAIAKSKTMWYYKTIKK